MADEMNLKIVGRYERGDVQDDILIGPLQIDISADPRVDIIQTIGTSAEALILGDVSAPGICIVENLDPTNFVSLRVGSGGDNFQKILPGEAWPFRLATLTPYAIANTAACKCRVRIWST